MEEIRRQQFSLVLVDYDQPQERAAITSSLDKNLADYSLFYISEKAKAPDIVDGLKSGADNFFVLPLDIDSFKKAVSDIYHKHKKSKHRKLTKQRQREAYSIDSLIGSSKPMMELKTKLRRICQSKASTVLITGDSGVGKGLVARIIHYNSDRADQPFVELNCSAIPESLLEMELFGYVEGAFTDAKKDKKGLLEIADQGSLFLDEISDMPMLLQVKLLKAIEEKTFRKLGATSDELVDVRIITATNRDLGEQIRLGNFREDLFYRLNVIGLHIPPLRERPEDIEELSYHFIEKFNTEFGRNVSSLHPQTLKIFKEYHWNGNVRELSNLIERIMLLEEIETITPDVLPKEMLKATGYTASAFDSGKKHFFELPKDGISLEEVEKDLIAQAVKRAGGNIAEACRLLGLSRETLRYRIKKYNIEVQRR